MRIEQPSGTRGSLKWLQIAVNKAPHLLQPESLPPITWRSPLTADNHAEYRDAAFLDLLGLGHLGPALAKFWPRRGPQWDALGVTAEGPVLVEAKAHTGEFQSSPTQASPEALARIRAAFAEVQNDLRIETATDWSRRYYQFANRIAHLWWLRQQGVPASLLFVSFLNDTEMNGPDRPEIWHAVFDAADDALGLKGKTSLHAHIHHVMPDVRGMAQYQESPSARDP